MMKSVARDDAMKLPILEWVMDAVEELKIEILQSHLSQSKAVLLDGVRGDVQAGNKDILEFPGQFEGDIAISGGEVQVMSATLNIHQADQSGQVVGIRQQQAIGRVVQDLIENLAGLVDIGVNIHKYLLL